jgi:hypothetical protein
MKSLFWLTYHRDQSLFGVVIIQAGELLEARMLAAISGLDNGADFLEGHALSAQCAAMVSTGSIARMLWPDEANRLMAWIESEAARKGIPVSQFHSLAGGPRIAAAVK